MKKELTENMLDDAYNDYLHFEKERNKDSDYDIDKDIEDMLSYDPNWYKEDFKRAFGESDN